MLTSNNVKKLPDVYCQTQDSNNAKMLAINEYSIGVLRELFVQLDNSLDLELAEGKTLDLYGAIVGQKRGGLNDTKYRFLIKAKVAQNTSGVDYATIVHNLMNMLSCNFEDIKFSEPEAPATVRIDYLPYTVIANAGFTSTQTKALVKMLMPIGVALIADEFQGTFEFSASDNDYDENKGFGTIDQTIGGTLGLLIGEDGDTPLPI